MKTALGSLSSFFCAAPTRQRLDPLDLFARLLIKSGVAEVDVPVQARVRVVLLFGEWVRAGCSELSSGLVALVCSARNPMDGPQPHERTGANAAVALREAVGRAR